MKKINDKILVTIYWALSSSAFLWLMSVVQAVQLPKKPGLTDLFISYFWFAFLLFSAGLSYHIVTALLSSSLNDNNVHVWKNLKTSLLYSTISFLVLIVGLILIRDAFSNSYSFLIGILYYFVAFAVYVAAFIKACKTMKEIKLNL